MGTLEISVFGTMSLKRDGQPLEKFPSRRIRNLLGYLVVNRTSVHARDHLAGMFWGDLDDRRARHCLNTALWRLHRLLAPPGSKRAPYLRVDSQYIGFDPNSDVRIDLDEFNRCISWAEQVGPGRAEYQTELYARAVDVHCGQLLAGCYDDWCLIEREQIQHRYLRALNHLLSFHFKRGEHQQAIDYARRILAEDPLREEVHRELMDVLLASNQPAAALLQYEECEQVLAHELGIQPMEETQSRLRTALDRTRISGTNGSARSGIQLETSGARHEPALLLESLSRLRDQIVSFDRACSELRAAIFEVDTVVRQIQRSASNNGIDNLTHLELEQVRSAVGTSRDLIFRDLSLTQSDIR